MSEPADTEDADAGPGFGGGYQGVVDCSAGALEGGGVLGSEVIRNLVDVGFDADV